MKRFDVQVLGAGVVGHALALSLARHGLRVALQPRRDGAAATQDVRAYALNASSVELLRSLKVWDALGLHAATPVLDMRVRGDAHDSRIDFSAWQQRAEALAWITDAAVLERELAAAVRFAPHVTLTDARDDAALLALCDGSESAERAQRGVSFERVGYGQSAVAARLVCSTAHQGVAHQWFRSPDVLALLPFDAPEPGRSYALVWSVPNARADEVLAMTDAAFEAALAEAIGADGAAVGKLSLASPRAAWPLSLARAGAWCGPGWVLLGDAAHVVHPLAGQGLNLGLADVATLTRVIHEREAWRDLGDEKLLRRYERSRLAPTLAMGQVTDGLLRLFSETSPAARELRNRGLTLANRLSPLKRWLTSRALDA